MAYSVKFYGAKDQKGEQEAFYLCSISEWTQFINWVKSLESKRVSGFMRLVEHGSFKGTDDLADEISWMMDSKIPIPRNVLSTLEALEEMIGLGANDERIIIEM